MSRAQNRRSRLWPKRKTSRRRDGSASERGSRLLQLQTAPENLLCSSLESIRENHIVDVGRAGGKFRCIAYGIRSRGGNDSAHEVVGRQRDAEARRAFIANHELRHRDHLAAQPGLSLAVTRRITRKVARVEVDGVAARQGCQRTGGDAA